MAPHSSTLAWKIPWMEDPGRLQSMGWRRVRHDWAISLSLFTFMHWRRKRQPTPVLLPGESGDGVTQSRTRLKWLSSSSNVAQHKTNKQTKWEYGQSTNHHDQVCCRHGCLLTSSLCYTVSYRPSVSQFSRSIMPNSLWPHGLQHTRLPCPPPTPRACSNSCPLSWWCHPTISSSAIPFSCLWSFPASGSHFLMSQLFTSGAKVLELFSISPSNEYSGLISFRMMDWFNLLAVQGTLKSLLQHHSSKASPSITDLTSGEFWRYQDRQ